MPRGPPMREPTRMRNAECGMRNCMAGSIPRVGRSARPSCDRFRTPPSAFRISSVPQSAIRNRITVPSPSSGLQPAPAPPPRDRFSAPPTCRPAPGPRRPPPCARRPRGSRCRFRRPRARPWERAPPVAPPARDRARTSRGRGCSRPPPPARRPARDPARRPNGPPPARPARAPGPPCSSARACVAGSRSSRIAPADGDRRLTSAITPTVGPASAGAKRRGSGARAARRASSRAWGRRPAMRSRVVLRMASRRLSGMLAFGRFSGRLGFGFRSGESVPLTRRQREILDFISGQIAAQGYAPSFEEIAQRFTFRSLATVHEHLTNLERKGYVRRAHNESRGIEVVPPRGQTGASELPLYGLVAAGEPIEAVSGSDTIAVPDELVPRRGRSYVLKVRGQSMIDEHIKDGDFIGVHERNQADNGQTVVALVQGSSATVKRFYREPGGWIRLEPANPAMTPLRLNERDVTVQGVVVGVIRRY